MCIPRGVPLALVALLAFATVPLVTAAVAPWLTATASAQEGPGRAAKAASQPQVAKVARDDVNVRSGPSVDFYALETLDRGALLVVLGPEPGAAEWLRVRVPGGVAVHVFGDLLKRDEADELVGTVDATRVLMRATPSKAYYPVHEQHLRAGEEVVVLGELDGEGGSWVRVVAPRRVHAWVHRDMVATVGPLTEHAETVATATARRLDALTEGRWSARERARHEARVRDASDRLGAIEEQASDRELTTEEFSELQRLRSEAPDDVLRERAATLLARVLREKEGAARAKRDADLARAREEAEARRRAEERAAKRYAEERRRAEAEKRTGKEPADAEGVITVVEGKLLLRVTPEHTIALRSRRFRLRDFKGERVRVRGIGRGTPAAPLLEVSHIEIVR